MYCCFCSRCSVALFLYDLNLPRKQLCIELCTSWNYILKVQKDARLLKTRFHAVSK